MQTVFQGPEDFSYECCPALIFMQQDLSPLQHPCIEWVKFQVPNHKVVPGESL